MILCGWWNDGKVMSHAGFPLGLGINESQVTESLKKNNNFNKILVLEYEHKPIGEMNYKTIEKKVASIGIKICDFSCQNMGLGTECLELLIEHLFEEMKYEKIVLDSNSENKRAQYVYEKLGFREIRTNINSWKNQIGKLQSSIDYELKRS